MTSLNVVVDDDAPCYRKGLQDGLASAGYTVEQPADLRAWARSRGLRSERAGVLSTVGGRPQGDSLSILVSHGTLVVVALLKVPTAAAYRHAFDGGAAGAVDWAAQVDHVVRVFTEAVAGGVLLPAPVLRHLLLSGQEGGSSAIPGSAEIRWLRELAHGTTIARLARDSGYSDREMHRRLNDLYRRMAVTSRIQAITSASRSGWIE